MNQITTFDPKKVTVIYDGLVITGFASDSIVEAEKNEDNVIPYVGVMGEVSMAINADNTGKIGITLASTSPFIRILSDKARTNVIAPISVIDMNDHGVNVGGTQAWIIKAPNASKGKEVGEIDVEFFVADYLVD